MFGSESWDPIQTAGTICGCSLAV